ncbi:type II toxin-antitoxin system RelE/ParE family toxin [Rhodocyclaceae bacterium SMB388]
MKQRWRIRLAHAAERDFVDILQWTTEHFSPRQARVYETTLRNALTALVHGPGAPGVRARPDLGVGVICLHVARKRRKGRHFIVFRAHDDKNLIEVLRILHDSMDLARHIDTAD